MENKAHALIAGIFTLILLTAAVLIGLWLNRDRVEWVPYQIATRLSVPGLNPQAAVRYRGLDVGKVDDISFDPKVPGQILVHLSIKPETPITRATYATLGYQGVTGIAYVNLDDDGSNPVKVPSSKQQVARIEMRPGLLDQLQTRGLAILEQTEVLTKRFNQLMSPENQKAMLGAFDNVSRAANEVEKIPKQLQPTLARLPAVVDQAERTLSSVNLLAKDANAITTKLQAPDGTIARLSATIDQIGSAADQIQFETLPLTKEVRSTLRTFNRTLDNLNERPQSLLFGASQPEPGPGEDGFAAPASPPR